MQQTLPFPLDTLLLHYERLLASSSYLYLGAFPCDTAMICVLSPMMVL